MLILSKLERLVRLNLGFKRWRVRFCIVGIGMLMVFDEVSCMNVGKYGFNC